jgi:ABC-type Fe3+ transport system permease subunit
MLVVRAVADQGTDLLLFVTSQVSIQRWAFMKDVAFYLMALLMIAAIIRDGKVGRAAGWQQLHVLAGHVCSSRVWRMLHHSAAWCGGEVYLSCGAAAVLAWCLNGDIWFQIMHNPTVEG